MDGPNKHALGSPCQLAHIPDVHRYTLLERYYGLAHTLARRTISAACCRATRIFGAQSSALRSRPRQPTASIRTSVGCACRRSFLQRG